MVGRKGKTATRGGKKAARGGASMAKMSKKEVKKSKQSVVDTLKVQNGASDSSESHQSSQDEMSNDSESSEHLQIPVETVKSKKSKKMKKVEKASKVKNIPKKAKSDSDDDSDNDSESESEEEPTPKNIKSAQVQKQNVESDESDVSENEEADSVEEIHMNNQVEMDSDEDEEDNENEEDEQEKAQEDSESSEEVLPKKVPNKAKKVDVPQKQPQTNNQSKSTDENPPSTRVFIANLSKEANSEAIQEFFDSHDLKTVDLYIPGSDKFHKGFAFAEFEDIETATRATQLSGQSISGSPVDITYARPKKGDQGDRRNDSFKQRGGFQKSGYGGGHGSGGPTSIIFVKNLPTDTTENDLRKHFKGSQEVRMMKNQDGSCRGHAYIEYDSQNSAKSAKESLSGVEIGGSRVVLDYAQPRGQGRDDGFRRDSFRGGRDRGGFRGGRFQRGGRDFGGRGGFGNRGGFGGVGKSRGGFNRGGAPSGKRIQFNDDDD